MIDVLIATGPEAEDFHELGRGDPGGPFGFKDDLVALFGGRRRGDLRASGSATFGRLLDELKNDGGARRLGGHQVEAEQIEKGEFVLLRRLVQPLDNRLDVAREDPGERHTCALLRRLPLRHVAQAPLEQFLHHPRGVPVIKQGLRSDDHDAVPSCR